MLQLRSIISDILAVVQRMMSGLFIFSAGDIIELLNTASTDWWKVCMDGCFPSLK